MLEYSEATEIQSILAQAERIVIVQADNPDGDSLGSALALESILGDLGKQPYMYCAVDMPGYLRYLAGWDRVQKDLPHHFDASILVDASTMTLLEKMQQLGQHNWLAAKPCIVLDHHQSVENLVPFATVMINDHTRASTGELIFGLSQQLAWPLAVQAGEYLMTSILGDTQGLTNQLTSATTYQTMAALTELGVDRPQLEEKRREFAKMPPEIFRYKALLIQRTELQLQGQLASVTIPQPEINQYSPLYNPAPLIQGDMLQTSGVRVAIVFKRYDDGTITGAIRCNPDAPIAADLAESLGGGGHAFASGFKDKSGRAFDELKTDCLQTAGHLLNQLEPIQHETV